jgi:hemolysin-activating ACP:hemolysin acyltransferase
MFSKNDKGNGDEAAPAAAAMPPPLPPSARAAAQPKTVRADAQAYSRGVFQSFGAIVAVCCRSKSHRGRTLEQIAEVVTPAVISGQFSLAEATNKKDGLVTPVAAVLWASVSEAVDRHLTGGATKLQAGDWNSGNIIWIMAAVGDSRTVNAMLKTLREKAWKGRLVKARARNESGKSSMRILQTATC